MHCLPRTIQPMRQPDKPASRAFIRQPVSSAWLLVGNLSPPETWRVLNCKGGRDPMAGKVLTQTCFFFLKGKGSQLQAATRRVCSVTLRSFRSKPLSVAPPPNNAMELTVLKRHTLCRREEQRVCRSRPAAHRRR